MTSQLSFDPLAGPDPLEAFTQAREPSNSWMSFDDDDATSAGPFHQSSMASNVDAKSVDAASNQVTLSCRALNESSYDDGPADHVPCSCPAH